VERATLYGLGLLLTPVALKGELRGSLQNSCWYLAAVAAEYEVCVPRGGCDSLWAEIAADTSGAERRAAWQSARFVLVPGSSCCRV
jgi:hypothetical protein